MAMNFIAQSMRRFGLAPDNKVNPSKIDPVAAQNTADPLGHLKIGSKWAYSTLEYPSDIQGRSNLGHYMMFYINVPVTGSDVKKQKKVAAAKKAQNMADLMAGRSLSHKPNPVTDALLAETGYSKKASGPTGTSAFKEGGDTWMPGMEPVVIDRQHHQGTSSRVIGKKRTTRTEDSIVLYMPPNIVENYSAAYKEGELGRAGGLGAGVASGLAGILDKSLSELASMKNEGGLKGSNLASSLADLAEQELKEKAQSGLGGMVGSDLKGMMDKADNQAINNFLEVMFTGISHRKFSYTWKFAPKNAEESENVYKIIQKFKYHMSPEHKGGNYGRYYTVPSEFDIFYMFRGEENQWLHKISSCVLMNMDVNYTPNQYQTFRPHKNRKGAPPVEMDLKLDFMETQLITRDLVKDGY